MKNGVIPRVELAVKSITSSSENASNSTIQKPYRRDFTGNTKNTPLKLASSRLDLKIEQDEIDESRDFDNSMDGDFLATRLNFDRRAHANHMVTGHNAPQHGIPEFRSGHCTQKNPLSQQFIEP